MLIRNGSMGLVRLGVFLAGGAFTMGCEGEDYVAEEFEDVDAVGDALIVSDDFKLGIQLGDEGGVLVGDPQYTGFVTAIAIW